MKPLLALKASAGTGKTYNLALRYLALLFLGAPIKSILAVTFTNKAAFEMRERVMEFLEKIDEKAQELSLLTGVPLEEILKKAPKIKEEFLKEDIEIVTMDSFIQKILRKFSYFAGVRRDFDVSKEDDFELFLESLDDKNFNDFISFAKFFEHSGEHIKEFFKLLYEKDKEIPYISFNLSDNSKKVLELYHQIVAIIEKDGTGAQKRDFIETKRVEDICYTKSGIKAWLKKEALSEARGFKKLVKNHPELEDIYQELKRELALYFRYKEALFLQQLFSFYQQYKKFHTSKILKSNTLSFVDIKHFVYKILQEEHLNRDFLYFRLDSRIEHILIDEFQDTAVEDWKIYEPLVDEIASSQNQRSFFYVGDTKQAIYGWRGGKKELFDYVARRYRMEMDELRHNFRSKAEIVRFVNEVFNLNEKSDKEGGYVEVSESENILEELGKRLESLFKRGVDEKDIAILVYTNADVLKVADFLESHFGKRAVTSNSKLLIHQPRAKAVIDLIKYLFYQKSDKEVSLYLYNFFSTLNRPYQKDLKEFNLAKKPLVVVKEIIEAFNLWDEATLELLEEVKEYKSIEEFIENIDNSQKEVSFSSEGIEVLTIHKAKGLAFEHVIVLDLLGNDRKGGSKILFDYDDITLKALWLRSAGREFIDPKYQAVLKRVENELAQERQNVAYVALTRARNSLFVIKNPKGRLNFLPKTKRGVFEIDSKDDTKKRVEPFSYELRFYGAQEVIEEEDEYNPNDFAAIYQGKAYHEALEIGSAYSYSNYGLFGLTKEDIERVRRVALAKIEELFKGERLREIPFVLEKRLGIMDLLILDGKEAVVIDYKSVKPADEKSYLKQVGFYKEALKRFGYEDVRGYLFYLDTMELREV